MGGGEGGAANTNPLNLGGAILEKIGEGCLGTGRGQQSEKRKTPPKSQGHGLGGGEWEKAGGVVPRPVQRQKGNLKEAFWGRGGGMELRRGSGGGKRNPPKNQIHDLDNGLKGGHHAVRARSHKNSQGLGKVGKGSIGVGERR